MVARYALSRTTTVFLLVALVEYVYLPQLNRMVPLTPGQRPPAYVVPPLWQFYQN